MKHFCSSEEVLMFSQVEFDAAFEKARNNHPTISRALGESVMKKFIERWESDKRKPDYARDGFGQLMRFTLNELKVSGKATRQMYSALIGFYYSRHAAYVNRRPQKTPLPTRAAAVAKAVTTVIEANGQLGWQL
jgi:hypothetical protein